QGLLDAHHHAGNDRRLLIEREPRSIPAQAEAVSQAGEDTLPGKAELFLLGEAGARDLAGRRSRPHGGDPGIDDGDRGLEGGDLLRDGLADGPRPREVEAVALEHAGKPDAEPFALGERLLGAPRRKAAAVERRAR